MKNVTCHSCNHLCVGEALRHENHFFHPKCFKCEVCFLGLAHGSFFQKDGHFYCPEDYLDKYGTKCKACQEFVEGDCVSALGNTYHKECFVCGRCGRPFLGGEEVAYERVNDNYFCVECRLPCSVCSVPMAPGEKVTYNGEDVLCSNCVTREEMLSSSSSSSNKTTPPLIKKTMKVANANEESTKCSGCKRTLKLKQAISAIDGYWHAWCFKCSICSQILSAEYMAKDGKVYCEKDYLQKFGVKCANCERFIAGKVLQAGQKQYHPTCAKCGRCGYYFTEGEDMFVQGTEIWHPNCSKANGYIDKFSEASKKENAVLYDYNQNNPFAFSLNSSNLPKSRTSSRSSNSLNPQTINYTNSYLSRETANGSYLYPRAPKTPEAPVTPNFHRPEFTRLASKPQPFITPPKTDDSWLARRNKPKPAKMSEILMTKQPPHLDKDMSHDIINQSRYPASEKPPEGVPAKIEREDFPVPLVLFDRLRSRSEGFLVKKEEEEFEDGLQRVTSPLGRMILREEFEKEKDEVIDPRLVARTPSGKSEPMRPLRYSSSSQSSALRNRWSSSANSPSNKSATLPSNMRNSTLSPTNGYLSPKSCTLPRDMDNIHILHIMVGSHIYTFEPKVYLDFSSPTSYGSSTPVLSGSPSPPNGSIDGFGPSIHPLSSEEHRLRLLRIAQGRSMPNVATGKIDFETDFQVYPLESLLIRNYRLPKDVDRNHLELHLSTRDFYRAFKMGFNQFSDLPKWKQIELKKNAMLF
ncbi:actin-binding LIM protein 1-like [Anneissia japonica]|uniref:actin-binding LIM protein 1-like n=1 Tax=Anneissia japonica TaxID=1529436 RepID=UPI0014254B45|nr:actin-binding LIM protein 1-like [Anneissia japonica]